MGGRGRAGPEGDGRSDPPPGPVGSGGAVISVGYFPSRSLSNGPLEGRVGLGDQLGWGPPPPASRVEHLTVYRTLEEKLRDTARLPAGSGQEAQGHLVVKKKKAGSPAGGAQWLCVDL